MHRLIKVHFYSEMSQCFFGLLRYSHYIVTLNQRLIEPPKCGLRPHFQIIMYIIHFTLIQHTYSGSTKFRCARVNCARTAIHQDTQRCLFRTLLSALYAIMYSLNDTAPNDTILYEGTAKDQRTSSPIVDL